MKKAGASGWTHEVVGIFGRTSVRSDGAIGGLDWERLVSSPQLNADGTEAPPNLRARCRGVRMRH